jgi:Zn-dependent protease
MQWFTKEEIRDIVISVFVVTLIFSFKITSPTFGFELFFVYLAIVIVAFLFHELAHKGIAMKFHCVAIYKMWTPGIFISLLSLVLPIRFIAPGAVVIYPFKFGRWGFRRSSLTQTEMGFITVAGLLVNLFSALLSSFFIGSYVIGTVDVFLTLAYVNTMLFFFNLLPIPPLDGSKVLQWKPWFWIFLMVIAIVMISSFLWIFI